VLSGWGEALRRLAREGLPAGSAQAYGFALTCIGIAALAHLLFVWFASEITPSILYNPAIFIAALVGGGRAGVVALVLSIAVLLAFFPASYFSDGITAARPALNWALYAATALMIIWVAGRYRLLATPKPQMSANAGARLFPGGTRIRPDSVAAYLLAMACIAAATLLRLGFGRLAGEALPLVSYYPAVLIVALVCGTGPGLLAMTLSLVVVWSEFPGPLFSFGLPTREESLGLSLYVFAALLTVWLAETYRHAAHGDHDPQSRILQWAASVLVAFTAVLLTTCVLLTLETYLAPDHLVLGYLLPTIVIAMHYGGTLAVITSFVGGLAAAYFLFPPKLSFYIAEPLHVAELGWFLVLAIIAGKAVAVITDDVRTRNSEGGGDARTNR
jgi:K+-sensing histidine kinase KdpD